MRHEAQERTHPGGRCVPTVGGAGPWPALLVLLAACRSAPPPPPPEFEQLFQSPFSKDAFLDVYPELAGHVYTADEYGQQTQRGAEQFDPLGPIRTGDRVRFWVEGDAAFDLTLPVTDLGIVDLPYVGTVQVASKTPAELVTEVQQRLAPLYNAPFHADKIQPEKPASGPSQAPPPSAAASPIVGAGEIAHPAASLPQGKLTLRRAVDAWTLTANARLRTIWIFREMREPGAQRVGVVCDLIQLKQGDLKQDLPLFPGDIVVVPAVQAGDPLKEQVRIRARREFLLGTIGREEFLRDLVATASP